MSLKGKLQSFDLPNVLQLLSNGEKTGVLNVTNGEEEVKIIIQRGAVIYATSSLKEFRLGYLMVNDGMISDRVLHTCLEESDTSQSAIGMVLVQKEYISQEVLISYTRKQVLEILYNLFFWQEGDFEYHDATHNLENMIVAPIQTMAILLEASRRMDEMSVITRQIPDMNMVFQISYRITENKEIVLNLNEWRMLSFINGKDSIQQIIEKSGSDTFSVLKILYALISFGIIKETLHERNDSAWLNYSDLVKSFYDVLQIVYSNLET